MAQTVANYDAVMKEVWTSDRLEEQFYTKTPLLQKFERTNRFTIGQEAKVPLLTDYSGGYSVKDSAGGSLNAADEIGVDTADYTLTYNWQRTDIEFGVLNQAGGNNHSVGSALNEEVEGAVKSLRRQVERQSLRDGSGFIARCSTTNASTTIVLEGVDSTAVTHENGTGLGADALVRRWLYPGLPVSIGTTADFDAVTASAEITAVTKSSSAPKIIVGSALTTTHSHYVAIAGARQNTSSVEMNGLWLIAGSASGTVGGLAPSTVADWAPASVDSTTTTLSLDALLDVQRSIMQETGEPPDTHVTSFKQQANFYSLLQTQARFPSDMKLAAGNQEGPTWNGIVPMAVQSCPDSEWYQITIGDYLIVTGKYTKPVWASDIEGFGRGLAYTHGNTNFQDAVVYALELACRRRNGSGALLTLVA